MTKKCLGPYTAQTLPSMLCFLPLHDLDIGVWYHSLEVTAIPDGRSHSRNWDGFFKPI